MHKDVIAMFLSVTNKTVYNYEKENRPIIVFLNKYFNENDINEFLQTNKISKLENINNCKKLIEYNRILEIIKLLSKYTVDDLRECLAVSYDDNSFTDYAKVLLALAQKTNMYKIDILKEINYILIGMLDVFDEKSTNQINTYLPIVKSFNKMIGFDFNENDIPVIKQIMSRYEVYNTLYDLDKAPKD